MAGLEKKETEVENVRVMGRINPRPGDVCLKHENTTTVVPLEEDGTPHHHKYTFDHIFGTGEKQEGVFDMIGVPTIDKIMEGYNGTVFAYGQSGSGKTHTMLAPDGGSAKCLDPSRTEFSNRGLIPRMCAEIFERIEKRRAEDKTVHYQVECSFYEIYNEELMDLLAEPLPTNLLPGERAKLQKRIRLEGSKDTFKIVGLVSREMKEPGDILALVQEGTARRHVASTKLNDTSSRSHSIIQIQLNQTDAILKNVTTSQLNLVDLAGCESLGRTGAQGLTMKEGMKINLSLTTLGIVINQLCRGEKHISFRDAMLTRVLQNSLGGNTLTTLIVTVSQLRINYSDTVSVLRFAERAKQIKNKARVNKQRSAGEWEMLYKQAQEEIASLQQRMQLKEASEKKKEKDTQNDELIDDLRRQLERVMREKDEIAAVLAEKEKDLFASDQRLQALQKELDEYATMKKAKKTLTHHLPPRTLCSKHSTTADLGLIELDKNESQAMYESTTEAIKKIEAQVAHETRVKEELQGQVKTLRAEAEGIKEENKQLKEGERQREVDDVTKERELEARIAELALLQRTVATRDEEVKKLQQDKEYELSERASSEDALKQQIEALKAAGGGAAGGALAGDLQALMDQSEEALKSLKEENKRLRDEGHNLKLKVTEAESASAQETQEVEKMKKQVEALQAMQNKSKQNYVEQREQLTRTKSDATALREENMALQERLASETATLENHLRTVELAKEKAEKEAQHIKDEHAGCRATIEQKDAEIRRLLARIAELESMYAQREVCSRCVVTVRVLETHFCVCGPHAYSLRRFAHAPHPTHTGRGRTGPREAAQAGQGADDVLRADEGEGRHDSVHGGMHALFPSLRHSNTHPTRSPVTLSPTLVTGEHQEGDCSCRGHEAAGGGEGGDHQGAEACDGPEVEGRDRQACGASVRRERAARADLPRRDPDGRQEERREGDVRTPAVDHEGGRRCLRHARGEHAQGEERASEGGGGAEHPRVQQRRRRGAAQGPAQRRTLARKGDERERGRDGRVQVDERDLDGRHLSHVPGTLPEDGDQPALCHRSRVMIPSLHLLLPLCFL